MRWIFLVVLVMQAASCGQKGPLSLPDSRTGMEVRAAIAPQLPHKVPRSL